MSSISNFMMKKSIPIGYKSKKKSIPININSNPIPGKFIISNQINSVASSYLSMGQKIQNSKNSKIIHVNTNSAINYYTNPANDSKQINSSITNSLMNNYSKLNNKNSEISGINFNNYFNNVSQQNYGGNILEKNIIKYNNVNFKARKHLSTISNSIMPNDIYINGYQTSKNNNNSNIIMNNKYINNLNNKPKSKIVSTNSKTNLSRVKQTYSTRPNYLDSRNKTKKIAVKSKIRQYKYQYKNGKPISTSFSNVYMNKNTNVQNSEQRDLFNYVRVDLMNNMNKDNLNANNNNIYSKINTIANNMSNNNLYEIKGRHFRHNTASFDNRDIINIFNKNNLLDKSSKNINNLNINNNHAGLKGNTNICINNINSTKNANSIQVKNNLNNDILSHNGSIGFKITNMNINHLRKKSNQFSKGKNTDSKIYIKDRRNHIKESTKYNSNINNTNNTSNNNNIIYHNYHTNNATNYNHVIHHIKNSHSINMNLNGIKKISIKQKEPKKSNLIRNNTKLINKPIPTPSQKIKGNNIIPSHRNIKINLTKFIEDVKNKQNNKIIGRKSLSIKRLSKENNSDFSISQLNDKLGQKFLKNNEEGNDLKNYVENLSNNKKLINKTIQEENKFKEKNNFNEIENNIIIDTNYISNIQNNDTNQKVASKSINEMQNKGNNSKINHYKINYNINSTNNNYYGKNKIDYSIDNPPQDISNSNINNNNIFNKDKDKDKENINDTNINNITDIINPSANDKNYTHENILHKKLDFEENNSLSSENPKTKKKKKEINEDLYSLKTKDSSKKKSSKKVKDNKIHNALFDEDNLDELPEDYDENFNDLYSIINKMNFSNVLVCVEGLFTPEGRTYKKYRDKFDKFYENLYNKKGNSFANSNMKPKKRIEGLSVTSNTKTDSSSSKKNVINNKYNDLNIVKDLNVY